MHAFIFHFEPLWTSFWINFRSLLAPLGLHLASLEGSLGLGPRMSTKSRDFEVILETNLAPFSNDFSVHFLIRFLNHFWSHFGAILGAKMEPKSIKNRFKMRSNFCLYLCSVPGTFFLDFGTVLGTMNPQKLVFRVGEVLFFRKPRFSEQMRSWIDFVSIFGGFGSHSGDHFGIKIASENPSKNRSDFESILALILPPFWLHFRSIFGSQNSMQNSSIFGAPRPTSGLRPRG